MATRRSPVTWVRNHLSFEGLIRMVADVVLINIGILVALAARLFYIIAFLAPASGTSYQRTFWEYLSYYYNTSWMLTLICLVTFAMSGFYTYGRFYRGKYKILVVAQAVTIGYVIFGALVFLTRTNFPRGALILSWALSLVFLVAARGWSLLWKNVVEVERRLFTRPEDRKIRQVLVIGGAGYIGSALLPKLLEKGYRVRLLDLLLYGLEPIEQWLDHPHLEIVKDDFRQIDKVVEAMQDVDAVIHLGGLVGDPACALDENLTIDINLMATRMVAEVAKGTGVSRFIFASTCSVYGASDQMLDERSQLNPVSLYARSKIASEKVLAKMADDHFAPTILRFSTIYGLSGRTRFDLVVNLLTAKALVDKEITIFGGGQWRPFLHVDDAARSIMAVLEAPKSLVRNQTYNVGTNEQNYTIQQVGMEIQRHVPEARIVNKGDDVDRRNYWVRFDKIQSTLGFTPRWTVPQGIEQVLEAIRSGKVHDYRDARYSNVKFLSEEGMIRLARHENRWAYHLIDDSASGSQILVDL